MHRLRASVGNKTPASTNSSKNRRRQIALTEALESRVLLSAAQAYNWQNVNIGAGGFVDGIFYSATQQNVIYARTDIGGLYKTTNDGATWTQLLDFVGNNTGSSGNGTQQQLIGVLSFAIDPENPNNLYADVGEYSGSNGAVFYSTNGGTSWSQTNLSFSVGGNSNGRGDGERIAVDPNNSNDIFLGSDATSGTAGTADGLWESTNGGHSFSQVTSFPTAAGSDGITFVLFDPTSGTPGNSSQTIYVGVNDAVTGSGTNLYETTNGGASWSQVTGTGTLPTAYLPGHAVLSGGNLYLGYANGEAPNTTLTNGGVYRYTPSTGVWATISPLATSGNFGYDGVAADPNNPNTIVVTSFDDYSGPDRMWRTVNANAATPTWTEVYDYSTAQNSGYNGYDTTRNTDNAPWTAAFGDGISNWAAAVAIDPFNSNQLMYGTGQGIWATNNLNNNGANTQLTEPNSWYFPDTGIEFTAVGGLATASSGVPLFSAMGDIFGFANSTISQSPAQGAAGSGSGNSVDVGGNVIAIVGSTSGKDGYYSTNDGTTFTAFASDPGSGTTYGEDTVAVSASGATILWSPSGKAPFHSSNDGASWTASTGGMASNGQVYADRVNASDFYYHVGNDLYFSSNAGVSFTLASIGAPFGGQLAVNPFVSGDLWIATTSGLYHSSNFGSTWAKVTSALTSTNSVLALGAPAPGQTVPAIYVFGTIANFLGVYRSDDGGSTWVQINDTAHQWGGLLQTFAADPKVYGRVYIGINGRGIIMGNPPSTLPADWTDTDISTPGNPGWAVDSSSLSNATVNTNWLVNGGGDGFAGNTFTITSLSRTAGTLGTIATATTSAPNGLHIGDSVTISGASPAAFDGTYAVTSIVNSTTFTYTPASGTGAATGTITASTNDQFNFTDEPVTGDTAVSALLLGLTNADGTNGTPQAGVMFRAGTNTGDPFVAMVQSAAGPMTFEYRSTPGGAVTTSSLGGLSLGLEYLEIVRTGNTFTGLYSSNGINWTQLGTSVTIAAMPATADVGLAATANFNSQLAAATFSNIQIGIGPSVTTPAAATPNLVSATTTQLTVQGASPTGLALTYTWSASTVPTGVTSPTFSVNGTSAANDTTPTFFGAGAYDFLVTITDSAGLSTTSSVAVNVAQTPTAIGATPTSVTVPTNTTEQFSATATDQFGNAIASPSFNWSITGSDNSIDPTGLATLGPTPGSYTVTATLGGAQDTAAITTLAAPTVTSFTINDGNAQRSMITSLTVVFNEPVTLASGAITLSERNPQGGSPTPQSFTLSNPSSDQETYLLTFTDPSYLGGSLPDGIFDLTIHAAAVTNSLGATLSTGDQTDSFYRLYGDYFGQGSVGFQDLVLLAQDFGVNSSSPQYLSYMDINASGSIGFADLVKLAQNFGQSLTVTAAAPPIHIKPLTEPLVLADNPNRDTTATIATASPTPSTTDPLATPGIQLQSAAPSLE